MQIRYFKAFIISNLLYVSSCAPRQESLDQSAYLDSLARVDSEVVAPDTLLQVQETELIYKDTLLDNAARFIAGLPQEDSTSFTNLEKDRYWQEYKVSMDTNWNKMYRDRLGKIKGWEESTFSSAINDTLQVFYPFSGPDFLHAYYLYPHAKEYIMEIGRASCRERV